MKLHWFLNPQWLKSVTLSDDKKFPLQMNLDPNVSLPVIRPNAFSQYPGAVNPPRYPNQYPQNPQYPAAPEAVPQVQQPLPPKYTYPQQYYGPPSPGQQQQQQQNVVVIGAQSPNVISQPPVTDVNTHNAIVLSCIVIWFCGWALGIVAYLTAGKSLTSD